MAGITVFRCYKHLSSTCYIIPSPDIRTSHLLTYFILKITTPPSPGVIYCILNLQSPERKTRKPSLELRLLLFTSFCSHSAALGSVHSILHFYRWGNQGMWRLNNETQGHEKVAASQQLLMRLWHWSWFIYQLFIHLFTYLLAFFWNRVTLYTSGWP
jgi:hypothetical protein